MYVCTHEASHVQVDRTAHFTTLFLFSHFYYHYYSTFTTTFNSNIKNSSLIFIDLDQEPLQEPLQQREVP